MKLKALLLTLLALPIFAQDVFTTGTPIAGSAVTTSDMLQIRDVSVTSGAGKVRPMTLGELVNVPSLFSSVPDGTFSIAKTTGLQTALNGKEPALGNPSTNGYVLSSTTGGTRSWVAQGGGGGGGTWGSITGTLSAQTDLDTALGDKLSLDGSNAMTGTLVTPAYEGASGPAYLTQGAKFGTSASITDTGNFVSLSPTARTLNDTAGAIVYNWSSGTLVGDGTGLTGIDKAFVGLGNVENTALSTWAGSTNITTLGTASANSLDSAGLVEASGYVGPSTSMAYFPQGINVARGNEETSRPQIGFSYGGFTANLRTPADLSASPIWDLPATAGTLALASQITGTNSGTNTGDQTITLTGDVTGGGTGSFAATLANTAVTPGSYTSTNITVDAKGRITAAANGSGGTVDNASLLDAIEEDPAATRESAGLSDPVSVSDALNWQPYVTKKLLDWESTTPAPLRVVTIGDSLSTSINLAPSMGLTGAPAGGVIGMNSQSSSGLTTNSTDWLTGIDQIAIGGNAVYHCGDANGQRADRLTLMYIKEPTTTTSGGFFDCSTSIDGGTTWIPYGAGTAKNVTWDSGTDLFTETGHGFTQGQGVQVFTWTTYPTAVGGNIVVSTSYHVIYIDANTFKLARSPALAASSTAIDLTSTGSGDDLTVTPYTGIGIPTYNATKIGAVTTVNLSTSNTPGYQVRVNNVTAGAIKLVAVGLYNSTGGGVIQLQGIANMGGIDITNFGQIPAVVFDPIWTALAPDLVLTHFADYAYEWNTKLALTGGATTNGSASISFATYPAREYGGPNAYRPYPMVGDRITGAGIPAGTYITAHTEGTTTATMSQNATATASGLALTIPGAWTDFYARCKAAYNPTDFVVMSMNPMSEASLSGHPRWLTGTSYVIGDRVAHTASPTAVTANPNDIYVCSADHTSGGSTEPSVGGSWNTVWTVDQYDAQSIAGGEAHCLRQATAQREWAIANNESFVNGFDMFRGYNEMIAAGFMVPEDKLHPTSLGHRFKNTRLWDKIPISRLFWNSLGSFPGTTPVFQLSTATGINTAPVEFTRALNIRQAGSGGLTLWDRSNIKSSAASATMYVDSGVTMLTGPGNFNVARLVATPMNGMHPGSSTNHLGGRESFWWTLGGDGIRLEYTPITANYTVTVEDYTVNVTANDVTVTLPAAAALNSSTSSGTNGTAGAEGRIYIIKNSTASNTTTIATTSGQLIDGSAPGTLAPGQSIKLQSTGAGWITVRLSGGAGVFTNLTASGKISSTKIDATLAAAATTLAITNNFVKVTGDAGANTLATITGGVSGQTLTLLFVDALVTITDTDATTADTVDLSAAFTSSARDTITLINDGNKWIETARSAN